MIARLKHARIPAACPTIVRNAAACGLEEAMVVLVNRVRMAGAGFDPEISGLAYSVMAAWSKSGGSAQASPPGRVARTIERAVRILHGKLEEPIDVPALATDLGMAYSHFRREFKARTGYAPWKYVLNQRLIRARRILASSDVTLAYIAERFGFSSPFHFSRAFHQAFGLYPAHWRQQVARGSGGPDAATPDNLIHVDLTPKPEARVALRPVR